MSSINYTNLLKLALPVPGELVGNWGGVVNDQIVQLLEDAIAGTATGDVSAGDWTLDDAGDGDPNESRSAVLIVTGSPPGNVYERAILAPGRSKLYVVRNETLVRVRVREVGRQYGGASVPPYSERLVFWDGAGYVSLGGVYSINETYVTEDGHVYLTADDIYEGEPLPVPQFRWSPGLGRQAYPFDVARNSPAPYMAQTGKYVEAQPNEARLPWDLYQWDSAQPMGLLVEGGTVNPIEYSHDWTKYAATDLTVTKSATEVSPATGEYLNEITDTAGTSEKYVDFDTVSVEAGEMYTVTLSVSEVADLDIFVQVPGNTSDPTAGRIIFDPASSQVVDTGSMVGYGMVEPQDADGDIWTFRFSFMADETDSAPLRVGLTDSDNVNNVGYTGAGANTVLVSDLQFLEGYWEWSSPLPTNGQTGTRDEEEVTRELDWIQEEQGTFVIWTDSLAYGAGDEPYIFSVHDGTENNFLGVRWNFPPSYDWPAIEYATSGEAPGGPFMFDMHGPLRIAVSYDAEEVRFVLNGYTSYVATFPRTFTGLDRVSLGRLIDPDSVLGAQAVEFFEYYPTALSVDEMAKVTAIPGDMEYPGPQ